MATTADERIRVTVCAGCAPGSGDAVARLRGTLGDGADIATTDCMNVCARPVSVSVRARGKAAYLFSGVDIAAQAGEIAEFVRLFDAAEDGIVRDARSIGALRGCLTGRIPA